MDYAGITIFKKHLFPRMICFYYYLFLAEADIGKVDPMAQSRDKVNKYI